MTFSKTTGDVPELHFPDGSRKRLFRLGPPNIKENIIQFLSLTRYKPEILVMECMALHPERQSTLSRKIFQPTHLGITNIKLDHQEIMGTDEPAIFNTIAHSFTSGSQKYLPRALKKHITPGPGTCKNISFYEKNTFAREFSFIPPAVIEENWGLIQKLGVDLKLDPHMLADTFEKEWEGINQQIKVELRQYNADFFNLFSANDLETAIQFTEHLHAMQPQTQAVALINTRADRPLRSLAFVDYFISLSWISEVWVVGSGRDLPKKYYHNKLAQMTIHRFSEVKPVVQRIQKGFKHMTQIYGLANYQGMHVLMENLRKLT